MTKAQPFEVLSTLAGGIELRHYPAHTVISVEVSADFESAGSIAFGPLVSYISGANTTGQKMAMTAPVVQAPHADSHTISFVLPEGTEMVMPGDNITMEVELMSPIAMDEGLRFAIREGGRTVGAGVVSSIVE